MKLSRLPILLLLVGAIMTAGGPVSAQALTVDTLLSRLFSSEDKTSYELNADFTGNIALTVRGQTFHAVAAGSYLEYRRTDGIKRRKVTITKLDLPVLLRPFTATVQRVIEDKVETPSESPETFHNHDIFLLGEAAEKRYTLVGIHRTIVDEMIDRYGKPEQKKDIETRRRIAQWLWTSPSMRERIVRPGPPYALRAVLDDIGNLYELTLFYNWGEVGTHVTYVLVNGQSAWRTVSSDAVSEFSGLGRVDAKLLLTFSNHCVNCKKP